MSDLRHHPLILRRVAMIHGFLTAARQLLEPILVATDAYRDPRDDDGNLLPPEHVVAHLVDMGQLEMAGAVSYACVAGVNLGYAYEHALKLLNFISTGKNAGGLRGREQHKLSKLYLLLPKDLRREISSIYKGIRSHDIEYQESFGMKPSDYDPHVSKSDSLLGNLEYWDRSNIFLGGRYKYVDATMKKRSEVRVYLPIRSVRFLEAVMEKVILPRLGLEYVSSATKPDLHK